LEPILRPVFPIKEQTKSMTITRRWPPVRDGSGRAHA
jgi:hypothetical protein